MRGLAVNHGWTSVTPLPPGEGLGEGRPCVVKVARASRAICCIRPSPGPSLRGRGVPYNILCRVVFCLTVVLYTGPIRAQMLAGAWVDQSEKQIDQARKTELRVIVMDATGRAVPGAGVLIEQVRSDFPVGVVLPESGLPEVDPDSEFWRVVNAVSLERMTAWPTLQPGDGASLDDDAAWRIEQALNEAEARGMVVRWGPLISADVGRVPGWVAGLSGRELADAVEAYRRMVCERFGGRIDQFDVYTQTLDHGLIENRAGLSVIRRLYESVPVASPGAAACARFDDALATGRIQKMMRQLTAMREAFIPVGLVAIDHRFGDTLERQSLVRLFSRLDPIDQPVILSGLTVGGDSELNAAINLETVLRTVMEKPNIQGVWFAGLTPDNAIELNSALIDETGSLTPSGQLIDRLYYGLWRTHIQTTTDELGNVRARAFPGAYRVTATLADGSELAAEFRLKRSDAPRVLLLEPLRPGASLDQTPE